MSGLHGKLMIGKSKLFLRERRYLQRSDLILTASPQVLTVVVLIVLMSVSVTVVQYCAIHCTYKTTLFIVFKLY